MYFQFCFSFFNGIFMDIKFLVSMMNPFMHSEMNYEQQKIVIRVNLYDRITTKKVIS